LLWSGCYSADEKIYYTCSNNKLFQVYLDSINLYSSKKLVGIWDGSYAPFHTWFFGLKNGEDGKIYMNTYGNNNVLHVINSPNNVGVACNFVQKQLYFGYFNRYMDFSLPNTPNFSLGSIAPCGVGVEEVKEADEFKIKNLYGVGELLQIPINHTQIKLYNTLGQLVYENNNYNNTFTLHEKGLFIYTIYNTTTNQWHSGKLEVQ
jgi:hypothetical protein